MRYLFLFTFFILLNSSGCSKHENICVCCEESYTKIGAAIECLKHEEKPNDKLLLIAFVKKNLKANQDLGWNIIADKEIADAAKRNYLLIILDASQKKGFPKDCDYFSSRYKKYGDETYFVIANQAMCPFGDWSIEDNKDRIIEMLGVGDGP